MKRRHVDRFNGPLGQTQTLVERGGSNRGPILGLYPHDGRDPSTSVVTTLDGGLHGPSTLWQFGYDSNFFKGGIRARRGAGMPANAAASAVTPQNSPYNYLYSVGMKQLRLTIPDFSMTCRFIVRQAPGTNYGICTFTTDTNALQLEYQSGPKARMARYINGSIQNWCDVTGFNISTVGDEVLMQYSTQVGLRFYIISGSTGAITSNAAQGHVGASSSGSGEVSFYAGVYSGPWMDVLYARFYDRGLTAAEFDEELWEPFAGIWSPRRRGALGHASAVVSRAPGFRVTTENLFPHAWARGV